MGRPKSAVILLALAAVALGPTASTPAPAATTLRTTPVTLDGEPRLALSPPRFATIDATIGQTERVWLTVRNLTPDQLTIRLSTIPLRGSSDPTSLVTPATDARSAVARDWVSFATEPMLQLQSATQVAVPVDIAIPTDARPGTYALALVASQRIGIPSPGGVEARGARVIVHADVSSQLVIRVPGDALSNARLRVLDAPRFIWGGRPTQFVARVENRGDTDLLIDGQVELAAFLGTASRTLEASGPRHGQLTLPDGVREVRMRWSDTPLIGWFKPELVVVGGKGSGVRITKELPAVLILPPWWLILLVALAIALPFHARRRRRGAPGRRASRRAKAKRRVQERIRRAARRRANEARRRP